MEPIRCRLESDDGLRRTRAIEESSAAIGSSSCAGGTAHVGVVCWRVVIGSIFGRYPNKGLIDMDVPKLKMNDGHSVPAFGLGTWQAEPGEVGKVVKLAIDLGYRHFDCARVYRNEAELGAAIREKIKEGNIPREDIFVTSKLWNTHHKPELVVPACKKSLENFGLDYLDLYLIHWPFAFQEHEEYFPRDGSGRLMFADYDFVDAWKEMEKCVELGLVKSIGLSNFNSQQIERVLKIAKIKPVMNQVECHPYLNQKKLIQFCAERGILVTAYSPLGSPGRPWGTSEEPRLLTDPKLSAIANRVGKTPAQVALRYLVQLGTIPIPKSTNPKRLLENIDVFNFKLDEETMKEMDGLNINYRYCQFRDPVMSGERKPKERKRISLEKKIEILDKLKSGKGSTSVAREYGLNEATVRTIKRMEDTIRRSVARGTSVSARLSAYHRDGLIEAVEKALIIWIEDNAIKRIPMNSNSIRQKALKIFSALKEKEESVTEFRASKGWYEKFKKRHNLDNAQLKGEILDEKLQKYPEKLAKIIEENSYVPEQVFNADGTGLSWKKMPRRTYPSEEGMKPANDRVTVLLCTNASGDRFLKPLMINRCERPRALRRKDLEKLAVHWRFSKNACMTSSIFEDWFHNCFVPEVKSYLREKKLHFKVLLLLNASPNHPTDLTHPNVRIEFLPSSIVQPLDQGIISTFKAYYLRRSFEDILRAADDNSSVPQVWKNFTIFDCIRNVASAVAEMKKSTLNYCWKLIWPDAAVETGEPSTENLYGNIINLAHCIGGEGFRDLDVHDIEEVFEEEEISAADLVELTLEVPEETTSRSDNNGPETLSEKALWEGLRLGRELETYFLERDPDTERALKFQRGIKHALSQYEGIYRALAKKRKH